MKKMNTILRKCKTLSRHLARSSSYSSLRSKSTRHEHNTDSHFHKEEDDPAREDHTQAGYETILVGSTRKPYTVNSEHLNHPILKSLLMEKENQNDAVKVVNCEVVLFDHLLWMLENADPNFVSDSSSLEELANLYVF